MTQSALGEALGITFQQVQKYERATNRVPGSALWRIAEALEVPVAYFYEGLGKPKQAASIWERVPPQQRRALLTAIAKMPPDLRSAFVLLASEVTGGGE